MPRTFLITGGAGFIGSNLIRHIFEQEPDASVVNLDLMTYAGVGATVEELSELGDHRFVKGDIRDPATVENVMAGADVVIHLAAESHVDRSIDGPVVFSDTNVRGTAVLLEAARRKGIERFIHVSTDEVYGSVGGFPNEQAPLRPSSPYSASKAGSDLLALSYHSTFGFPVIVSRCTNNFGPYQFPEKVIPLFVTNLMDGLPVPLYGTGLNERDWLFVEDHCRALMVLVDRGAPGEVYNIGADAQLSNLELTHQLLALTRNDASMIQYVEDRLGHDLRYAVDSRKMRALGWEPLETLESELARTVEWYQERQDWWRPLKASAVR